MIEGGAGTDTFTLNVSSDTYEDDAVLSISGVERVFIRDSDGLDLNASEIIGVEQWWVQGGDSSSTYVGDNGDGEEITTEFSAVGAMNTAKSFDKYFELEVANGLFDGSDDRVTVVLDNAGSSENSDYAEFYIENADGDDDLIEAFDIVSTGSNSDGNYLYLGGTDGTTEITVSGSTDIEIDLYNDTVLARVDASAATGAVMWTSNLNDLEVDFEYIGSQGADDLEVGDGSAGGIDITVNTGAGDDRVVIDEGELDDGDSLDGGEGTDTLAIDTDDANDVADGTIATSGFEILELSANSLVAQTVDLADFDSLVISANLTGSADVTVDGSNGKMVTFTENTQSTNDLIFSSTGSADALDLLFADDASGTVASLILDGIESIGIETSMEDDDVTFTSLDISGAEEIGFVGAGDIDIDAVADDGSLEFLDLSGMEGAFDNAGAGLDVTELTEVSYGNLDTSIVEFASDFGGLITFGSDLENDVTFTNVQVGVGGVVLDLSGLGVDSFAGLTVTYNDGDGTDGNGDEELAITSTDFDGTITLVGTYTALGDLDGAANFMFA